MLRRAPRRCIISASVQQRGLHATDDAGFRRDISLRRSVHFYPVTPVRKVRAVRRPTPTLRPSSRRPRRSFPTASLPIFNGRDLTGWHVSKTNHHGIDPDFHVEHGVIVGTQRPFGRGGILLTDRKYKNFEVYIEVKPDYGNDSGLFLRSSEAGEAYQVMLDYLPGGGIGGVYGERLTGVGQRAGGAAARGNQVRLPGDVRRARDAPGRRRHSAREPDANR